MNEIIEMRPRESAGLVAGEVHQFSLVEIRQRVNLVQEVMRSIMKSDTHYGIIPGTKKPSLYKPGAEVLCVTFRIADKYEVEDLTVDGMARYRVRCIGVHQVTGIVLGEGMGGCSSHEEKYKWRAAVCTEEFDATPEKYRRLKFSKWNNKVEKKPQIRTESADQDNTILKMACKRAKIAMTLNVTGASDIFTQDIEDLPEELRGHESADAANSAPAEPVGLPLCTDEIFAENKDKWKKLIDTGKKTVESLIAMISTRAIFNDKQRKEIASWAVTPKNDEFTDALDASGDYVPE